MESSLVQLSNLMQSLSIEQKQQINLRSTNAQEVLQSLKEVSGSFKSSCNQSTLADLVYVIKTSTNNQLISGSLYCASCILHDSIRNNIYSQITKNIDMIPVIKYIININKNVTQKSQEQPYCLIHNSLLFLIYLTYGACIYRFQYPDKLQEQIIKLFTKIETDKYKEYQDVLNLIKTLKWSIPQDEPESESMDCD